MDELDKLFNIASLYTISAQIIPTNLDDLTAKDFAKIFLTDIQEGIRLKKTYNHAKEQKQPFRKYLATNEELAWGRGIVGYPAIKRIILPLN
jgi:hypothetical protein